MCEPALQGGLLVRFVEDVEGSRELRLGCVLEGLDVTPHHCPVHDQVALPVQHVGDHEHLHRTGVLLLFLFNFEKPEPKLTEFTKPADMVLISNDFLMFARYSMIGLY